MTEPNMTGPNMTEPNMTGPNKNLPEKTTLKPSTLLSPVPVVLVSCQGNEKDGKSIPNLITLAWAGTICSEPPMVSISIRPSRYSHQLISESGEFVLNLVSEAILKATDYCGVRSGRDVDKFSQCGLNAIPMPEMAVTPAVAESPLSLACKVRSVQTLGTHDVFMAEIVSVIADTRLIDETGKLSLDKAGLVAYSHGEYRALGRLLGFFGFSVAAPEVIARRMPAPRRRWQK
jgi:flavin reductase (DIM6/NTAB) family NADH-FMN oxidoreductase RutF